jgi:tripartite-type tricarboxylate transporter receptor subunit TctC
MSLPTLLNRRQTLTVLGGSLAAPLIGPSLASAQDAWPSRSVRYVNAFPAGGSTDTLSRIFCQKMTELSGQSFVVENKVGAGGTVGADAVAKAAPDGYTLGLGGIANNVLAVGAYAKLPYHAAKDFTFISNIWQLPNVLCGRKDIQTTDLKELIALFKKEPGKWTYASGGIGTSPHLSGEMFNTMAGVETTHVPYKGGAPAMVDLLGGRVDLLFDNLPGVLANVRAGTIKAIAVTNKTRVPELPDVPAISELLPGYALTSWISLIGPAKMPADLVARINGLAVKALADPGLKARYNELGASPMPMTPAEATAFRDSEEARLIPIMKAAGIKPEQ